MTVIPTGQALTERAWQRAIVQGRDPRTMSDSAWERLRSQVHTEAVEQVLAQRRVSTP